MIGAARREDIVSALRRGTVPGSGLDALAVGIDAFASTLDEELESVASCFCCHLTKIFSRDGTYV